MCGRYVVKIPVTKTGKLVKTSANVRKVIKDGKIIEKYHIVNYADFQ